MDVLTFFEEKPGEEPATEATLRWRFPHSEPVARAASFAVRRELAGPPTPGQLALLERRPVVTFQVDREPAEDAEDPGVLRAELRASLSPEGGLGAPQEPALDEEMTLLAADVWTRCFVVSNPRARHALYQVLGVPLFDGLIAARFLTERPGQHVDELVTLALGDAGKQDELARDPEAQSQLTAALLRALDELRALLLQDNLFAPISLEDGAPPWNARLARYVEELGERELGEQVRERGREQATTPAAIWSLWLPTEERPPLYGLAIAALALWRSKVRPQLERAKRNPPALAMAVHEPMARLLARNHQHEDVDGKRVLARAGDVLARVSVVEADTLNAIFVNRGIELFGSVTAHRLVRWEILTAHKQALEGHPDPRVLTIEGGYAALTHDRLGIKAKRAEGEVRDILEAQHACEIPLPPRNDYSRLLIRRLLPAAGGRRTKLELVLGTALLPNYVYELQAALAHSRERARATRLVPVLELPPFLGRPNEHGAQATLSMLLVAYLRDHARDLITEGGVRLDEVVLAELARQATVPAHTVRELLDRWANDGEDGPAFLKQVKANLYTLGDAHTPARAFLEEAGSRELEGVKAGQRSVTARQARLQRFGKR